MAYTTINKSTDHFNTKLYSGTGSTNAITGVGFQPDWTWIKARDHAYGHHLQDAVRGTGKDLYSNLTDAEYSNANSLTTFGADGFTVGSDNGVNNGSKTYVSWNWKANGAGSTNTDGSINSTVSANTTSGFSIVSWTGSGADATVGHGLNSAPTLIIVKNRTDASTDWRIGQVLTSSNNMTNGNGYYMELNDTKASTNPGSANQWGSTPTAPTNQVFTVGSNNSNNGSSDNMIAYCFHSVEGYSKFGTYAGNGNADGPFVYTGFKPAFIIIKNFEQNDSWRTYDNKRLGYNVDNNALFPNATDTEATSDDLDILSNGFKVRATTGGLNNSNASYIFMAFGQSLVGSNNIPATAR